MPHMGKMKLVTRRDWFVPTKVLETYEYYVFMVWLRRKTFWRIFSLGMNAEPTSASVVDGKRGEFKRFWNINHVIDVCFVWRIFGVFFFFTFLDCRVQMVREKQNTKNIQNQRESIIKIPNSISYHALKCTTVRAFFVINASILMHCIVLCITYQQNTYT